MVESLALAYRHAACFLAVRGCMGPKVEQNLTIYPKLTGEAHIGCCLLSGQREQLQVISICILPFRVRCVRGVL
jgi:hypothetical protein